MKVTVRKKRWTLEFINFPHNSDAEGKCDDPSTPNKKIKIEKRLKGERKLEVIIHEIQHAGHWDLCEEAVTEFARDAARILTRLGYTDEK